MVVFKAINCMRLASAFVLQSLECCKSHRLLCKKELVQKGWWFLGFKQVSKLSVKSFLG
ncbi:hypothetical protein [Helicobacter pylori]|uniref:hypothetical protein n=1 Tax=Helicobacter pylori TaxID=210 RepID=UPI00165CCF59|nr:hypothetical protein [Helicobacter pylori]